MSDKGDFLTALLGGMALVGGAALVGVGVTAAIEEEKRYNEALSKLESAGGRFANAAHYARKARRAYSNARLEDEGFDRHELRRAKDYADDALHELRRAKSARASVREAGRYVAGRMERILDSRISRY